MEVRQAFDTAVALAEDVGDKGLMAMVLWAMAYSVLTCFQREGHL